MHHSTCCSHLGDSDCGVLQRHQPEPIAVKTKRSKASRPRRRSCGFHKRGGRAIAVNRAQPAAMLSLMTALALAMYTSNASSHICSKRSQIWFPAGFFLQTSHDGILAMTRRQFYVSRPLSRSANTCSSQISREYAASLLKPVYYMLDKPAPETAAKQGGGAHEQPYLLHNSAD